MVARDIAGGRRFDLWRLVVGKGGAMMKEYTLTIKMILTEDSPLLDCLRVDEASGAPVQVPYDAGERMRADLVACGFDKLHYELGHHESEWTLTPNSWAAYLKALE